LRHLRHPESYISWILIRIGRTIRLMQRDLVRKGQKILHFVEPCLILVEYHVPGTVSDLFVLNRIVANVPANPDLNIGFRMAQMAQL
jgi:hypothetical protein